jgi:hypothetical protein
MSEHLDPEARSELPGLLDAFTDLGVGEFRRPRGPASYRVAELGEVRLQTGAGLARVYSSLLLSRCQAVAGRRTTLPGSDPASDRA